MEVAVTLWAIWTTRRKVIHEDIFKSLLATHGFVKRFISELEIIDTLSRTSVPRPPARTAALPSSAWKPPPMGHAKIQVDGGTSSANGVGSAAAVCRDQNGLYLASSALVISGVTDPAVLEAITCCEALALAKDLSFQHLVVACDCKSVVQDIQDGIRGAVGDMP